MTNSGAFGQGEAFSPTFVVPFALHRVYTPLKNDAPPPNRTLRPESPFSTACSQIGVKDGRTLVGNFNCIDKQGNIVLINTLECQGGEGEGEDLSQPRTLGLVLVPASHRVSCHVESTVAEEFQLLSL